MTDQSLSEGLRSSPASPLERIEAFVLEYKRDVTRLIIHQTLNAVLAEIERLRAEVSSPQQDAGRVLPIRDAAEFAFRAVADTLLTVLLELPNRYGDNNTIDRRVAIAAVQKMKGDGLRAIDSAILNNYMAAEVSSPARPPLESRLAELVLKPLLVQLNWAVSHDPNPDQMTINISEFAVEAHKGLVALLAEVSSAPPPALRELIAKWRERAELSHPPLSYEEGICKGIGLCLDELEAALASSSSQEHP